MYNRIKNKLASAGGQYWPRMSVAGAYAIWYDDASLYRAEESGDVKEGRGCMWTVIYIASNEEQAERIQERLSAEGFMVDVRQAKAARKQYEILVPESEVEEVQEVLSSILHSWLRRSREVLTRLLKNIFYKKKKYATIPSEQSKRDIPEGIVSKCKKCGTITYAKELEKNDKVCPKCGYHFPLTADERINMLVDGGTFFEYDTDLRDRKSVV